MKKITSIFIAIALLLGINSNVFSQSVAQGDVQVRAYYGYPYMAGTILKSAWESGDSDSTSSSWTEIKATNTNHIGGSVQFLVSDKVGLGIDYTFAKVALSYRDGIEKYKLSLTKHRINALMTFHFANGESVDPYFNVGAGYKMNVISFTDPDYDDSETISQPIPVSMRIGIGLNYFFTDFIGLNAEVGLGGPLAQFGLTFKF